MTSLPAENLYGHTKKLRFILEVLDRQQRAANRPLTVLDFGCGNGNAVSRYLIREGVRFVGVDVHEPSLTHARAHYGGPDATFCERVPADLTFDVIVYADILEHLDDPVAVLHEHCTALAPGGRIVGAVPNGYGPFEMEKRVDHWLGLSRAFLAVVGLKRRLFGARTQTPLVPYNEESGHVQFFTKAALTDTLARGGFELESFHHGAFAGAPTSERLLGGGAALAEANARVADAMPHWAVSTWYFTARRVGDDH